MNRDLIDQSIDSLIEWYNIARYRIQHVEEFKHHDLIKTYIGIFHCYFCAENGEIHRGNCGIYTDKLLPQKRDRQVILYFPGFDYTKEELKNEIELKIKQLYNTIKEQKIQEDFT